MKNRRLLINLLMIETNKNSAAFIIEVEEIHSVILVIKITEKKHGIHQQRRTLKGHSRIGIDLF